MSELASRWGAVRMRWGRRTLSRTSFPTRSARGLGARGQSTTALALSDCCWTAQRGLDTCRCMRRSFPTRRCTSARRPPRSRGRGLRKRCDGRLVTAYAQHSLAAADKYGSALLEVSDELERIGALRYRTEAAADAARRFVQAGRQDSARRAVARSRELFGCGQGGTLPPIEGLDPGSVGLTPREEQLVELASLGLSNTQIADRLVLSVRTVESRVYRAMQKLGVKDRRELQSGCSNTHR
jgi:DNA-binding NarL/FixJ family response regulator